MSAVRSGSWTLPWPSSVLRPPPAPGAPGLRADPTDRRAALIVIMPTRAWGCGAVPPGLSGVPHHYRYRESSSRPPRGHQHLHQGGVPAGIQGGTSDDSPWLFRASLCPGRGLASDLGWAWGREPVRRAGCQGRGPGHLLAARTRWSLHAWPRGTWDSHGHVRGELRRLWLTCPCRPEVQPMPWRSPKDSSKTHLWTSEMALQEGLGPA